MKTNILILSILSILFSSCNGKIKGFNQFNQYYSSFADFLEKMSNYQVVHKESEKFLFEIPNNYNCESAYGIEGVCYCPLETKNKVSHKEGDICPNFYYRVPFYKLYAGNTKYKSCYVYFLDKIEFNKDNLYWDAEYIEIPGANNEKPTWPSQYYLKSENNAKIVKVECFNYFEYKEILFNNIKNIVLNI